MWYKTTYPFCYQTLYIIFSKVIRMWASFGIFESENGYCVYLIGSESYDVDDDDWACDVDYEPVDKYLNIEGVDVDPDKFLNEVITILLDIISLEKVSAWLLHTKYITVGFDDGVLEKIR